MSLTDLVSQLQIFSKSDSHRQVLDVGSKILGKEPSNLAVFKQCLVAFINLDNYISAKEFLEKHASQVEANQKESIVELGYIYYKLNDEKALEKLNSLGSQSRGFKHILAQHYYRIGKYNKALAIYRDLLAENITEETLDLSVNERAVISQIKDYSTETQTEPVSATNPNSYDQKFNSALIQLRNHNYEEALELLHEARDQCKTALAEYEQEELLSELAPIDAEIAFVTNLTKGAASAKELYEKYDVSKLKNKILKIIIANNLSSLEETSNNVVLYKTLGFPNSLHAILDKLTIIQIRDLQRNEILLAYKTGKSVSKSAKKHETQFPESLYPQALAEISRLTGFDHSDFKSANNERLVFRYAIENPEKIGLCLFSCQLSVEAGKYTSAARLLETVVKTDSSVLLRPAVSRLLIAVYDKLDREGSRKQLLLSIYEQLIAAELTTVDQLWFLRFVAFQMISFDDVKAKELFQRLDQQVSSSDPLVSVVLGNESESTLGDIETLIGDVDVSALIEQGLKPLVSGSSSTTVIKRSSKVEKRKRSKPKKLPKDLTKQIDAERWLPMKDRSYYKPKKGKKGKDTQGGVVDQAAEQALNISSATTGSSTNKKAAAKKKKKGKK